MGFVFLILFLAVYCLPMIVAKRRHHPDQARITLWSLLLGWTIFAWIACLVYALKPIRLQV